LADAMEKFAVSIGKMMEVVDHRFEVIEQHTKELASIHYGYDSDGNTEKLSFDEMKRLSDLGPIMPLLDDDSINDILINGARQVYVERNGLLELTGITFPNDSSVMEIGEKIVKAIGRKIDPRRPLVDARLLDGSRVNIIAPPLAVDGTTISIRKFAKRKITLDVMKEQNNLSAPLAEFLRICGKCRLNILISGGTGSGKTTLLNAISQSISEDERVVTIEDAAELQLQQPHVVRLETRPITSGINKEEEVTMRDLVKNSLRMRPDRIIVGEVRGAEAFDMMQAMNTGHEGSLTTVHANHPRDALSRIENMIGMANMNIPPKSVRAQIASALHLVIQVSRMRDGHRRISYVSEIVGMEGDVITMQDLFTFIVEGEEPGGKLTGQFKWQGILPRFVRRIAYYGELESLSRAFGVNIPRL
jgi:pilus assembly protein CpaF